MPTEADSASANRPRDWFPTTHWSVVLAAGGPSTQQADIALESLCRAYWQPLYSFIRHQGHTPVEAQDLTQSFFVSLLTRQSLRDLHPHKGRFRSFLLASLKYFLADEWDKRRAVKRGGQASVFSLDAQQAERCYAFEPKDESDPSLIFERRWALTLLDLVLRRLEIEMTEGGKQRQWQDLKPYLLDDADAPSYADLANRLGLSVSAVKMGVSRLRQRYGELLRAEVAKTVANAGEVEEEVRHLLAVLRH